MSEVQSEEFVERLKDSFDEMVVYKDLKKSNFIAAFKLPSFMRDFRMMMVQSILTVQQNSSGLLFLKKKIGKQSKIE